MEEVLILVPPLTEELLEAESIILFEVFPLVDCHFPVNGPQEHISYVALIRFSRLF